MIGQLLDGRYRVVRTLGSGGFGQTFMAEDTRRPGDPICVVKHLKPASTDPEFLSVARRLFQQEAESLEILGRHEQIPRLLAFFEQAQEFFLVQDLVEGTPLSAELALGQRWTEAQVITLLQEVLDILAFIHRHGVIHRDIKPDNIIRRHLDRKLVLVDFGAVKQIRNQTLLTDSQISPTVVVGTPGYMASEQSRGKPRPNSDIYALGVVAIQALTGMLATQLQEDQDGELIWRGQAQVSAGLDAIITKMVRYYFKVRYQSATEVLDALHQLEPGSPQLTASPQSMSGTSPPPLNAGHPRSTLPTQAVIPQPGSPAPSPDPEPPRRGVPIWAGLGVLAAGVIVTMVAVSYVGPAFLTSRPAETPAETPDPGLALLDSAQQEAETSGNLGRAIALAQDIPSNSTAAEDANRLIRQWQLQWQDENELFQKANQAFEQKRWYVARDLAYKLPRNPYWDRRANPIYFEARRKIEALETPPQPSPSPSAPPSDSPQPPETPAPTATPAPPETPEPSPTDTSTPEGLDIPGTAEPEESDGPDALPEGEPLDL